MREKSLLHAEEGTILLSKIIKSRWTNAQASSKVIGIRNLHFEVKKNDVQKNELNAEQEKQRLLEEARIKAEQIIQQAQLELEQAKKQIELEKEQLEQERQRLLHQAKEEGYKAGFQQGKQQGYDEQREFIQEAKKIVQLSQQQANENIERSEHVIFELGMKTAERILGHALNEDPSIFSSIVKQVLKEAREYRDIQIHIHPSKYSYLLSEKEELQTLFPNEVQLYVYPNDELPLDGCLIESPQGRIDASVDTQLNEIRRQLQAILEGDSNE
jgi:flagellar assembly protein FliH